MTEDDTHRALPPAPGPMPPTDDALAAELRGFGAPGIAAMAVILLTGNVVVGSMIVLPIGAVLVLGWVHSSRTPWRELGLGAPVHAARALAIGLVFGVAFKFVMKALVMPLLGAEPVNQAYHFLAGNRAMLPAAIWAMFAAGFGEELVFRGYLFERLGKLLGNGARRRTLIVLLTSLWFGVAHYANQGLTGAVHGLIFGLVFGTIAMRTGRIWMLMIAHTAFDLTALAIIYWDVEAAVAHLIFR